MPNPPVNLSLAIAFELASRISVHDIVKMSNILYLIGNDVQHLDRSSELAFLRQITTDLFSLKQHIEDYQVEINGSHD